MRGKGRDEVRCRISRFCAKQTQKLLGTSASLLVTSALLVVTMFASSNKNIRAEGRERLLVLIASCYY